MPRCCVISIILAFFFSIHPAGLHAQFRGDMQPVRPSPPAAGKSKFMHEQEFSAGAAFFLIAYSGDIDQGGIFPDGEERWRISGEAYAQYRVLTLWDLMMVHIRATGGYYPLEARSTDYSFHIHGVGAAGALSLEFFPRSPLRVAATGGIGVLSYRPDITISTPRGEAYVALYGSTERITPVVPLGIAIVWSISKSVAFQYQFTKTLTLTDRLDGLQTGINDNFQHVSFGLAVYF